MAPGIHDFLADAHNADIRIPVTGAPKPRDDAVCTGACTGAFTAPASAGAIDGCAVGDGAPGPMPTRLQAQQNS
jgi:hypothetical protein